MWHPTEDFAGFLAYKALGEISTLGWLRSLVHRQHFPVFRWDDPCPSLMAWSQLPSRYWRYVVKRGRTDAPASWGSSQQARGGEHVG